MCMEKWSNARYIYIFKDNAFIDIVTHSPLFLMTLQMEDSDAYLLCIKIKIEEMTRRSVIYL